MRACTRCIAEGTHLLIVDDGRGLAAIPLCLHHAMEALEEGREVVDLRPWRGPGEQTVNDGE
jgi:hypothetical protein